MTNWVRAAGLATLCLALAAAAPAPLPQATPVPVETAAPAAYEPVVADDDMAAETPDIETAEPAPRTLSGYVGRIAALPKLVLDREAACLATAVYFEAKGEPLEGQLAVAEVILNRVASGKFARSVCGVISQRGQFSFDATAPKREANCWRTAQAIALIASADDWRDVAGGATFFHAARLAPQWRGRARVARLGNHVFYR